MGPSPTSKTATSQIEAGLYTEAFAAVLAEHGAPAPISAPVEVRRAVRGRQRSSSDDWGHIAALGWLLLLSTGAASWYAIVDPIWSTPITIPGTTSPHIRPTSMPSLWLIESATLLIGTFQAAAAADEWLLATTDPILPKPAELGVKTAALSTPATVAPSQTTHRPAPYLIASLVEATPSAPPSKPRLPRDTKGVRRGGDPEKPVTLRNGEVKGTIGNPFVDLFPEKPQSGWPNISTASRAGTEPSQSQDPQSDSSSADAPDVKSNATPNAGSQDPHHSGGAPSDSSQGENESTSDKAVDGSNGPANGAKGPQADKDKPAGKDKPADKDKPAGKDKPADKDKPASKDKPSADKDKPASKDKPADKDKQAGKSAPGGPQDNHNSNRSGPSPEKADKDKNSKSDGDKKDKGSGGKDNSGKGPH